MSIPGVGCRRRGSGAPAGRQVRTATTGPKRSSSWSLALVAPGLVVAGAPWELLALGAVAEKLAAGFDGATTKRARTVVVTVPALACMVAWRTPSAVNALRAGGWLLALEALSLGIAGAALWLECIGSGTLVPRGPRPQRIAVAAISIMDDLGARLFVGDVRRRLVTAVTYMSQAAASAWPSTSKRRQVSCGPWLPGVSCPSSSGTWCNGSVLKRTPTTSCTAWSMRERRRILAASSAR